MKQLIILFLLCVSLFSSRAQDTTRKLKILSGRFECGRNIDFKPGKIESGLALALDLSGRFRLISGHERDSVSAKLSRPDPTRDSLAVSLDKVAAVMGAYGIAFVRMDRLQNMLRAEVQFAVGPQFSLKMRGLGYSLIRYKREKINQTLMDPAILQALQRAVCACVSDSALYVKQTGVYNVKPAATLVPGGLRFINDMSLTAWDLFANHTVNSFDAVVNIFDAAKDSPDYVCYDVDTRDSIYALFKLLMIENDGEPSRQELDALHRLEVKYYITGSCTRNEGGATIVLQLCTVNENATYTVLRSAEEVVTSDDVQKFRSTVGSVTRRLLGVEK